MANNVFVIACIMLLTLWTMIVPSATAYALYMTPALRFGENVHMLLLGGPVVRVNTLGLNAASIVNGCSVHQRAVRCRACRPLPNLCSERQPHLHGSLTGTLWQVNGQSPSRLTCCESRKKSFKRQRYCLVAHVFPPLLALHINRLWNCGKCVARVLCLNKTYANQAYKRTIYNICVSGALLRVFAENG